MGWHLRFSKGDHLRVLALKTAGKELEKSARGHPEWQLGIVEKNEYLQADFIRKTIVYEPK